MTDTKVSDYPSVTSLSAADLIYLATASGSRNGRFDYLLENVNEFNGLIVVTDPSYGAVGDVLSATDGAITTGTANLTSASAAFTTADPGKRISVAGAGVAGASLDTTIATFVSSTEVTLTVSASTTVSGAKYRYGTDISRATSP